jgi:rhamnose transport system ATP-binding protein
MRGPLLQLTRVAKSFGAVQALREVCFELQPGEVHALLGENGAGKSTLIKLVSGALAPDTGTVAVDGRQVRRLTPALARRLGIACVYQQPALFPELTVAENIALRTQQQRVLSRVRWAARRDAAQQWLQRLGARISPDTEIRHLSLPEQQLVEIACALGTGARILMLDEPTASLTGRETEWLFGLLRELRARGAGIIYISHRLEEIFQLADRVTVLRDGQSVGTRVAGQGTSADELIHLMVGRQVPQASPPARKPPGDVVLALEEMSCAASGLRQISLELRAGEILGLAGLVGAGRTELARVLFGLTPADSGRILLGGRPVSVRSPQQAIALGIAYLPEDRRRHGLILEMALAPNLTLALHRQLFPRGWLRPRAERALALDFMRALAIRAESPDAPASSLSGGNQQKLALARWLATKPRLLILDEPTQGVDVAAKSEIHRLIHGLAAHGLAVLLISSDLPEVLGLSDRLAVMRGGTVAATLPGGSQAHAVMAAALGQKVEAPQ